MRQKDEKLELEKEKLSIEISKLKKPWWKKSSSLFPILTFFITVSAVAWSFASGVLDSKYAEYQARKAKFELDLAKFENQRESMEAEISSLNDSVIVQKQHNETLKKVYEKIQGQVKTESQKVQTLVGELNNIERIYQQKIKDTLKMELESQQRLYFQDAQGYDEAKRSAEFKLSLCESEKAFIEQQLKECQAKQSRN